MATAYETSLTAGTPRRSELGVFRRLFDRLIEAKQKQANREVLNYLRSFDAESLSRLGYTKAEIERIFGKNNRQ